MRVWIVVAAALIAATTADAQQRRPEQYQFMALRNTDRNLASLCERCQNCVSDNPDLRQRLADAWRRRDAIISRMSDEVRAEVARSPRVSDSCLALARQAATGGSNRPSAQGRGGGRYGYRSGTRPISEPPDRPSVAPERPTGTRPSLRPERPTASPSLPPPSGTRPTARPTPPPETTGNDIRALFPWPPPTPSTRRSIPIARLAAGRPAGTWGEAADRIEEILQRGQFESWGYYLAADGFAIVTRVEQLDGDTGAPIANARWAAEPRVASSSNFLGGLLTFSRPVGHYRIFVFVVTSDPVGSVPVDDESRFFETARDWSSTGAPALPDRLRRKPLSRGYQVIVLVYEFEHAVGGRTRINVPSRWPFDAHLGNAGIVFQP